MIGIISNGMISDNKYNCISSFDNPYKISDMKNFRKWRISDLDIFYREDENISIVRIKSKHERKFFNKIIEDFYTNTIDNNIFDNTVVYNKISDYILTRKDESNDKIK